MKIIYPVIGSQTSLPMYLTGIGKCDPENTCHRQSGLTSHQFLFTLGGSGVLEIDGKELIQTKGCCFYLAPDVPHRYYPQNGDWKTVWLVFRGRHLSEIMSELGFKQYISRQIGDISVYINMIEKIYSAARDNINGSEKCSSLLYELVLKMQQALCTEHTLKSSGKSIIGKAVDYIDEYYMNDISLQQLTDISGVSLQHFCRCFKAQMGMRPVEYIALRRIAQSKYLLLNTDNSIDEIAKQVGYSGATYFGMVFRKYEGISPSSFRKSG